MVFPIEGKPEMPRVPTLLLSIGQAIVRPVRLLPLQGRPGP